MPDNTNHKETPLPIGPDALDVRLNEVEKQQMHDGLATQLRANPIRQEPNVDSGESETAARIRGMIARSCS